MDRKRELRNDWILERNGLAMPERGRAWNRKKATRYDHLRRAARRVRRRLLRQELLRSDASSPAHRKLLKPLIYLVVVLYEGGLTWHTSVSPRLRSSASLST